jgi:hypothetical protein
MHPLTLSFFAVIGRRLRENAALSLPMVRFVRIERRGSHYAHKISRNLDPSLDSRFFTWIKRKNKNLDKK